MEAKRLLLADDERELSQALVAILRHAGYEVDASPDGEDALYKLNVNGYDLVILDIMMPKVDGLTVLRTLREEGHEVPVLLLTARAEIDDRVCGLDAGANDYLVKPFAAKELLARIRVLTRTSPGAVRSLPSFGDLAVDEENSRLTCGGDSVSLTATELRIMRLLVERGDGLTTVEQIRRDVWGLLSDTEQSAVWVNVSNLRKKLRRVGSRVRIAAARGLGYRLELADE
ncbi:two component transcriptional regulator, winged helix family [Olsenella uli DSM 7084]|uniref:Two component transcriptional regulator, winged helix family n=1 Tax=Olsenella uli (strain ATCC 49627 / DSM 7084 / CCUG 31166 / CIP 109912 / JCM 12494 / LMG 11480 / NCIMB 702895 / VPI D76D-27C) TaxID=633147 RepID=E1QW17_OLSUV|nr:response regulator transcription factor [Olsenella uli]ADK68320.1 two component transcriptional regulator, winged helix family [Olsenella uli DSM 7084]